MKHALIAIAVLSSAAFGQVSPPQPQPSFPGIDTRRVRVPNSPAATESPQTLSENYILTLTATEKDQPASETSFVVATPSFKIDPAEDVAFVGTIIPEEGGSFLINYTIAWQVPVTVQNNVQFKSALIGSAVRLRPGDSVQIYKSNERSYKLTLTPLPDQAKKK